jgi:very-short-patch-repair endonuclease
VNYEGCKQKWEWQLWAHLRKRQLDGLHFRRQHPVGHYIVDFYCHEHRLIIELDGPSHDEQVTYDDERTAWLEAHDYRIIRFTNEQVQKNLEGVLIAISMCAALLAGGSDEAKEE